MSRNETEISYQWREAPYSYERCSCAAPLHKVRCGKPAAVETTDPYSSPDRLYHDVCRECFDSHFPAWLCSA